MRCIPDVVYSCRARVQYLIGGVYTVVARGPLRVEALGRLCQSSVITGGFPDDNWRTYNTYQLVIIGEGVWGSSNICRLGAGTPVINCVSTRTFRNGESANLPLL